MGPLCIKITDVVQQSIVHYGALIFLMWHFKFLVSIKVYFLKVGFLEIAFRGN